MKNKKEKFNKNKDLTHDEKKLSKLMLRILNDTVV